MNLRHRNLFLLPIFLLFFLGLSAQRNGSVLGTVKDDVNKRLEGVKVTVEGDDRVFYTDSTGRFRFIIEAKKQVISFEKEGFRLSKYQVTVRPGATEVIYLVLKDYAGIGPVYIEADNDPKKLPDGNQVGFRTFPIETKEIGRMPSFKGDIESKIVMEAGVTSNNEFSSQYRVRGGNFDENLIYVNGIEVYRPLLIRSGQQEGLGFLNSNLASNVSFSAGGFEPRFADKLSSALDVTYKDPHHFHGSAEVGVLNINAHVEGSSKNKADSTAPGRFTYLVGGRRFSTVYLLNSLDTQGDYRPTFYDLQGMFTYKPKTRRKEFRAKEKKNGTLDTLYFPTDRVKISTFFNVASNKYSFIPTARETQFGTVQNVFQLRVAFEGQEIMSYLTGLGALMIDHKPNSRLKLKYIFTAFKTIESEEFDVEGGYFLSDVNPNFGNEGFNEVIFDRGIGTNFRHGRNYLNATVLAAEQRGDWFPSKNYRHKISFGVRYQQQVINDELTEWEGVDSAGYFNLTENIRTTANLNSFLVKTYLQDNWKLDEWGKTRLVFGSRAAFNSLNSEIFVSPRATFLYNPSAKRVVQDTTAAYRKWQKQQFQLRLSAGVYHQPAFYREMRSFDGSIHTGLKAQSAIHFIAGGDYLFKIWNRPFKFYGEVYYKILNNLIPYEVDNVRLRYYPENVGKGYATGLDLRVNGEFISGVDSWMSFSLLQTKEDIPGDSKGYIPRPTDQRFSFSMYFQDELPINPTYKVHINFIYGSGMKIGPPRNLENRAALTAPAYNRVDLGFSKMLYFRSDAELSEKEFGVRSVWLSLEVFNLFQRANTVSYTWISDIYTNQFAVPNFLSARLVNLRLMARF